MDILGGGKFDGTVDNAGVLSRSQLKLHNQYDNDVVVGLRYAFNHAAAARRRRLRSRRPLRRPPGRIWCSSTGTRPT